MCRSGYRHAAFFSDTDPESLELAAKVARWTINNMQAQDGHFYYRDLGWKKVKTPMFHWGQGTMFKALAHLLSKLDREAKIPARRRVPEPFVDQYEKQIVDRAGCLSNADIQGSPVFRDRS